MTTFHNEPVNTSNHQHKSLPPVPDTKQEQQLTSTVRRTPRVAVLSLLCGLMAFFTIFIFVGAFFAIIAVVSGHVAINRIRHSSDRFAGDGLAMTGVVMGYTALVGTAALMLLLLFAYQPANQYLGHYRQEQSLRHASQLYFAAESYARDHRSAYPKQWDDLKGKYINPLELERYLRSVHSFRKTTTASFKLVSHQRPVLPAASAQVVVIQEIAPPHIDSVTVVYADGTTEQIANPNRDFER